MELRGTSYIAIIISAIGATCQAQIDFLPGCKFPSGTNSYSVVLGDLNNDGILDAVVTDAQVSTISVLMETGGGNFALPDVCAAFKAPKHAVVGDFNNDGHLDIAATAYHSERQRDLRSY